MCSHNDSPFSQPSGFTLTELIIVISILAILAAFAIPRFMGSESFAERSAQDELIGTARYAQQLSMIRGIGGNVRLVVQGNQYGIQANGAWLSQATGEPYPQPFPKGVNATAQAVNFLPIGDAQTSNTLSISLTGKELTRRVCIEPTGYAHAC